MQNINQHSSGDAHMKELEREKEKNRDAVKKIQLDIDRIEQRLKPLIHDIERKEDEHKHAQDTFDRAKITLDSATQHLHQLTDQKITLEREKLNLEQSESRYPH